MPLWYSTSLSAVTLNDHKGQIIAKRSKVPTPPPLPPHLYPHHHPHANAPVDPVTSSSLCRWYNWHSYNDFTATGLCMSGMCANVKVAWIILSITICPVIGICGRVTVFLIFFFFVKSESATSITQIPLYLISWLPIPFSYVVGIIVYHYFIQYTTHT